MVTIAILSLIAVSSRKLLDGLYKLYKQDTTGLYKQDTAAATADTAGHRAKSQHCVAASYRKYDVAQKYNATTQLKNFISCAIVQQDNALEMASPLGLSPRLLDFSNQSKNG